jgi:2-phosphosulfolactate phosphatase
MIVEALFLAQDADVASGGSFVLIDVLRTSATLISMLARGARDVIVVSTPEEARAHGTRLGNCLLCGESGGARPPDFDHGNSPRDYAPLSLHGQQLVFTSSNGAKAMARLVGDGRRVLIGSYPNATATVRAALRDAEARSVNLAIVGSGRNMGTRYGIEDCHCAGFLVDRLIQLLLGEDRWRDDPPDSSPHRLNDRWNLEDSAFLALQLYRSFGADFDRLLLRSGDAQILRSLGLAEDFPECLEADTSRIVPEVTRSVDGHLVVNPVAL